MIQKFMLKLKKIKVSQKPGGFSARLQKAIEEAEKQKKARRR